MSTPEGEQPKRIERKWPYIMQVPVAALGKGRNLRENSPIPAWLSDEDRHPEQDGLGQSKGEHLAEPSPSPAGPVADPAMPADLGQPKSPWLSDTASKTRETSDRHPERDDLGRSKGIPDFSRHARRCNVCSHPDRDVIEAEFIRWRNPDDLTRQFKLGHRSSLYRHAHVTGLFNRRRRELGRVLETILEAADFVNFETADLLIRATRVYAHLDDEGRWYEPPKTVKILHGPCLPDEGRHPEQDLGRSKGSAPQAQIEPVSKTSVELDPASEILIATAGETEIPLTL